MKSVCTKAQGGEACGEPGALVSERIVSSADGFELVEEVYENDFDLSATKSTVVTTANLTSFGMDAYAEDEWHDNTLTGGSVGSIDNPYPAGLFFNSTVSLSGSQWTVSGNPKWLNNVPITFWSWNTIQPARTATHTANFSYTVEPNIADQEDLVFAFNNEVRKFNSSGQIQNGKDEKVNIYFYHALSAIQFLEHENMSGYRISNIRLTNVNSHTECVMTSTDATPGAGSPNITFAHTSSVPVNYSQAYAANDASLDEPADYATSPTGRFKTGDEKTFIIVPQTIGDATKLTVTFTNTASSETTTTSFDLSGLWEAGKYYIYKIDLGGNIHVDISEQCSATAKSAVKFQNTSNVNEYIRAAVVANWYDNDGNIVAAWNKTRDGNITLGSGWTENGGFYYHNASVAAGAATSNLFDSFTKPANAPVSGAHFEMTILAQAVASDGVASCVSAF